ncbi:MAG TPA: DinB family protein [Phycisphaerae bacterium]|nr:DinB family protein [Phycisphaerae bacterium]
MTTKELLLHQTELACNGDEMSLLCGVYARKWTPPDNLIRDPDNDLSEGEAARRPDGWYQGIGEILKHVAECKVMYMTQAFGPPPQALAEPGESLTSLLACLEAAQAHLKTCLAKLDEAALARPVPTSSHGESAAHLFWVLAQHDVAHGSQIVMIRDMLRASGA